ncbi:MAG TPA: hypothetical protein VG944_19780 [Fimbriimonas sp.]|nr:hypothetical protein [Fimbriimonas sp.]
MNPAPQSTVPMLASTRQVAMLMITKGLDRVGVMNGVQQVGLITQADLLKTLAEFGDGAGDLSASQIMSLYPKRTDEAGVSDGYPEEHFVLPGVRLS